MDACELDKVAPPGIEGGTDGLAGIEACELDKVAPPGIEEDVERVEAAVFLLDVALS
jgi:hypothetical protein